MNRNRIPMMILSLIAAVLLVAGGGPCGARADNPDAVSDPQIADAVDRQLMRDAAVPADRIRVSADDGIVTLSGSVTNILARDRAEVIAETVKGVRGIVNRLDVDAKLRADPAIREDVKEALGWDPATESWEVAVTVEDGAVTLGGSVDSWQEKALAARVAKGVGGVTAVRNDLAVRYAARRSDAEIREDVESALRWYTYVDDGLIDVAVNDGRVTLTGTVGSMREKTLARAVAWVAGVEAVDHSGLEVAYWAREEELRKDKFTSRTGNEIMAAIGDSLAKDPRVDASRVTIAFDAGMATLTGTVGDLKAKRAAGRDAGNVVGVWGVENRIKVAPEVRPGDGRIKSRVAQALTRDPYVDRYRITVKVVEGEVYLYGDVASPFEKGLADDAAARQKGVSRVHNFIEVREPGPAVNDPYVEEGDVAQLEGPAGGTAGAPYQSDWEIDRNVRRELFWSPFVEAEDIEVTVNDGVVELTGTVDSWSEREQAEQSALKGGARSVDNDLAVVHGPEDYRP